MSIMRKRVLFITLILFLMLNLSFILAEETILTDDEKIDLAYECLENETAERTCEGLLLDEKIFSLLAIEECKDEVISESDAEKCWPSSNCALKETAQAILALEGVGRNTEEAEEWLLSQNTTISDILWYLQIESNNAVSCTISYAESVNTINIGEDKKIDSNAGSCLSLAQDSYWLKISSNCHDYEYEISCDSGFLTSLLFKKPGSDVIHVSEETSTAAAGGITTEKINSFCFMENGICDYEGSLWSALVLDAQGYDVSVFLPYLVTMIDEYPEYLPESFLYLLTGYPEFRNDLLLKQKSGKWWLESGDKYYDTALALYPFQYDEPIEKINSMNWLLEVQDESGCWENNLKNTAFVLYSLWPRNSYTSGSGDDDNGDDDDDTELDCEKLNYFCESRASCDTAGGNVLTTYSGSCTGTNICCDQEFLLASCTDQSGEICKSNEYCKNGDLVDSFESSKRNCCVGGGKCTVISGGTGEGTGTGGDSECEENDGECRSSCLPNEKKEYSYSCASSSQSCCMEDSSGDDGDGEKSYLWVWILGVLVVLVLIAIFLNQKLKVFWMKITSKSGKDKKPSRPGFGSRPGPRPGGIPPRTLKRPQRSVMGRRIVPSQRGAQRRPMVPKTRPRQREEVDEVLKKLKDMSK